MNFAAIAVRRGVTFTMIYLIVVGFGLFSLSRLGLDLYPDITFPMVITIADYPGASPEDMETLVTRPLEGAVSGVKDVEEVTSTSKQGLAVVTAEFDWGKDMEAAETDVRRALDFQRRALPDDVNDPMVFAFDPSLQPVVMMMVSGPHPPEELRRIALDEIEPRLVRLPGIASAEVVGGLEREIHVTLDPGKIAAFGLDPNAVVGAVYRENQQEPGGSITQGALDFTVQTYGKYESVAAIREVVVAVRPGAGLVPVPIKLGDVAEVEDSYYESQRILEVDGVPAVWVMVRKQSGANTVKAARAVIEALPGIKRATAADVDFKIIFDQSDFIRASLGNLSTTAWIGVILTFLVLLFFLRNLRSALIVSLAIPTSVIATFGVMAQADMTLNVLSMAGLALSIGMLVDNAIVVLENIYRLREEGRDPMQAAIEGAGGVGLAVTASTLTTAAVFVPVLFVPGIAGVLFRDMSVTIVFALGVSLVVALTLVPLAASRLLGQGRGETLLARALEKDVLRDVRPVYGRALHWVLGHRWMIALAVTGAVVLTVLLAVILPTEFVTEDDNSWIEITIEAAAGTSLEDTYVLAQEAVERVEATIAPEERKLVSVDLGIGKGFMALFSKGVHAGMLRVPLVGPGQRQRSQAQIEEALRQELRKVAGLKSTVGHGAGMFGGAGDIEVELRGHDLQESRRIGLELRDRIAAMPEVADVTYSMDDQKPEVRVRFDRRKLAQLGLSSAGLGNTVSALFMGRVAGRYAEGGDEYDILVRYPREHRLDLEELRRMPVATPAGAVVPLGNVADIAVGLGPVDITRLDQQRVTRLAVTLRAEYPDRDGGTNRKDLGRSIDRIDDVLSAYTWPAEFTYHIGGSAEDFQTSFSYLGLAFLVAVFLVYMVMASQFESLLEPFVIMFTVPLAGIGVVLMFVLTRSTMDMSALIGAIMLVGIVVNNGIVLVDAANQLRQEGLSPMDAVHKAALRRLRPVLLTMLTTILGMVPLALEIGEGSAGWAGMAKAVIGGLLTSSLLTLFVVPTLYTVALDPKLRRFLRRLSPLRLLSRAS